MSPTPEAPQTPPSTPTPVPHVQVAIAGSGFGGLGTAIRLTQAGFHDFLVFERGRDVGGVWRDNTYPGCACDVESHLYSFSFARNPEWSRTFSPSKEIQTYLRGCAERFGLLPRVRFDHEILRAEWDEDAQRWRIETTHGPFTADFFVAAVGALSDPAVPDLPGLPSFEGKTFHSARWDHDHDLADKRVAVIGTGASAIQFVPAIQPKVSSLALFQRTPPWILPRHDAAISERKRQVFRGSRTMHWLERARIYALREVMALPFFDLRIARVAEHLARRHLARSVRDPVLRAKLTPSYAMGCKRVLLSDDYLRAVTQSNVDLVTEPITEITPRGVRTADGKVHEVDTIIFGTGFQIQRFPFGERVYGKKSHDTSSPRPLSDTWREGMTAHLGTTVHGYPNFFVIQGPNTGLGHTSVITMIESQIEHIVNALRYVRRNELASVEPRAEAQAAFVAHVDAKMKGTVWTSGGCASWYLDARGRNSTLWPGFTFTFKRRVEPFEPSEYVVRARRTRTESKVSSSSLVLSPSAPLESLNA